MQKIIEYLQLYLFPAFCMGCEREGRMLCKDCRDTIDITPSCLNGIYAATKYEETGLIAKIIHARKYEYIREMDAHWRFVLHKALKTKSIHWKIDIIVPVPLHRKRFVERGFNQSSLIAEVIGEACNVPVNARALKRVKYTGKQAALGRDERLKNTKNAFQVTEDVSHKKILLVDDVYTTGATLEAAASALKNAGATEVYGCVLARPTSLDHLS